MAYLNQIREGDQVKDYGHAARLFVDDNYRLAPKHGFLFHVAFTFGPSVAVTLDPNGKLEAGMLVKAVDLPSYKIDRSVLNAYNRKNEVHTKINYNEIKMTFHDDTANVIMNLWNSYYQHYFKDTAPEHTTYQDFSKYNERISKLWGFTPEDDRFFTAIKIYSLSQKKFTEYTLVNPIITSFNHGRHDSTDGSRTLEHDMSVAYEVVQYRTGVTSQTTVDGFATLHYDQMPSPLGNSIDVSDSGPFPDGSNLAGIIGNAGNNVINNLLNNTGPLNSDTLRGIGKSEIASVGSKLLGKLPPTARYLFPKAGSISSTNLQNAASNIINNTVNQLSNRVSSNGSTIGQGGKASPKVNSNWKNPDDSTSGTDVGP